MGNFAIQRHTESMQHTTPKKTRIISNGLISESLKKSEKVPAITHFPPNQAQ